MIRVADYVVARLFEEQVKHIFMITGRGILYLSDAVAKHEHMMAVSVHHEQSAGYAANGYAQYNNHLGACFVSTGCGSTNAITGVLNAWQDQIPVIYVSGQNFLRETTYFTGVKARTYGNQEANIIPIVDSITKYSVMVTDPHKIGYILDKAIHEATSGIKGPVWIDIPVDVQNMRIDPEELERFSPELPHNVPEIEKVQEVLSDIYKASRPIMILGEHVRTLKLENECLLLSQKFDIPIVAEQSVSDLYMYDESNFLGTLAALGGNRCANFAVQNADLILAVGATLNPATTGDEYHRFAREARIVFIHECDLTTMLNTIQFDDVRIYNLSSFVKTALSYSEECHKTDWIKLCRHWKSLFPRRVCSSDESEAVDLYDLAYILSKHTSEGSVFVTDAGLEELIIPSALFYKENQRCIHPVSQGSMGTALGLAIGSYFAAKKEIIVIVGDGSVMMNIQEMATLVQYDIPIKIFVINNNLYDIIRQRQKQLFRNRTIGTDGMNGVAEVDFEKISRCFDFEYQRIGRTSDLNLGVEKTLQGQGQILCEVIGKEGQKYLHNSYRQNEGKRLVKTYLEDQSPFLDLDLIKKEMIVDMDV